MSDKETAPRIYAASRASVPERPRMWQSLRASGVNIVSSWIDEAMSGETADLSELWVRIAAEIASADCLVLYVEAADFPLKGALIEVGLALGLGKPVRVVSPGMEFDAPSYRPIGSWIRHPKVERFKDLKQACRVAVECTAPAPQPADLERDLYALLRGICEDVIDWMATLSYDNVGGKEVLDHPLTKEIRLKLQRMYDHPLDNKLLIRTDQLEVIFDAATPQVTPTRTYSEIDLRRMRRYAEELRPYLNKEYPDPPRGLLGSIVGMLERSIEGTSEQASPTPEQCPKCNSADRSGHIVAWAGLEAVYCQDSWHGEVERG